MVSIKGIYDGKQIQLLGKPPSNSRYKVLVTFLETVGDDAEVRDFASQTDAFDFWNDEREDLYQDYLKKSPR